MSSTMTTSCFTDISEQKSPIRIGIWCAYHITLEQSEGIGVFAHNLARGLASLSQCAGVTMMIRAGDEHVMEKTVELGKGRITTASIQEQTKIQRLKKKIAWKIYLSGFRFEKFVRGRIDKSIAKRLQGKERLGITRLGQIAWQVKLRVLHSVMRKANRIFLKLESQSERDKLKIIDSCDVWIIPYVGLAQRFTKPTVVAIHDLVCYHFPDMLPPNQLRAFKELAEKVSTESTIAACMSNFICDNDLRGVLKLPAKKIRVIEPAAPSDFGRLGDINATLQLFPMLQKKYVFYPSAFRGYKNHELLVDLIEDLQKQGDESLHVVFTGIHAVPDSLRLRINESGVGHRIHVLGKVDREVLSVIYKLAWATIVPSFYEQGSYPLMEAMYWGCPIACSNIKALLELLEPLGESMRFFDPADREDLMRVIQDLELNREQIVADQQSKRDRIFGRKWSEAAYDWANVCNDAIELDKESKVESGVVSIAANASQQTMEAA
jgi:glycosyltransferase involved in cell wall biosynthesis